MSGFVGEVRMFPATFVPGDWVPCDGRLLSIAEHDTLFSLIGTTYGGDGVSTFAVPDLRGRTPLGAGAGGGLTPRVLGERGGSETHTLTTVQMPAHQHTLMASGALATATSPAGGVSAVAADTTPYASPQGTATLAPAALGAVGGGQPHENRSPVLAVHFGICTAGVMPPGWDDDTTIGEIRLWAGTTPPAGFVPCDGRELSIIQNEALFSIVGTTYGGNGIQTFRLPDLRGRVPVHASPSKRQGYVGGVENVTLTTNQIPAHAHAALGTSAAGTTASPAGATWAATDRAHYGPSAQVAAASTGAAGGSQPHPNMPPYTALSYVIAVQGVYPSRN